VGEARDFKPVRLILGVLSVRSDLHRPLVQRMEELFGPIELITDPVPFLYTDYYDREMGKRPDRFFIVFERLMDPTDLVRCKLATNGIEQEFAEKGKRTLNLDPGILSAENLILATTKNRSHRIPLGSGIYGEVTLLYAHHDFQDFPWTYADYKSTSAKALFRQLRTQYLELLKQLGQK